MLRSKLVTDYMTPLSRLIVFYPEQSILEAISLLIKHKISGGPVVNKYNELIGMISEKDCLRVLVDSLYNEMPPGKVEDYMSKSLEVVRSDQSILQVAEKFLATPFKRFPVVDQDGNLLGQISRADVLRATNDIPMH
ncbi:CBS domain-containing protein [Thermonema lapsum]|uniref:CBS domain-containing protein n=1 Tax=Thermonema lapsum TaxID=28195 RepID=A0A846MP55_9BACT|nr:CBS domain-containing protein [Thermonema lapsum]NIK73249.1 CBS domain-containing protein [Thermonema lapsum]